jgi:AraC-like DNA-binding protein
VDLAREVIAVDEAYYWDAERAVGKPHAILQYTVRGEGRLDYRGKTHRLTPGTAFLVHNKDPDMAYHSCSGSKQEWEILWCSIIPGRSLAADMIDRHGPVYRMPPDSWFLGQVRHYLFSGQSFLQLSLAENLRLLSGLMIELAECSARAVAEESSGQLMQAFCEYVHVNISLPVTVAEAATHLKVSREHLTRTCQEQLHVSPASYINQAKMREATRLLRDPHYIVKQVSFMLGYDHASHFARVFRRLVGVSPREFRSSLRHHAITPLLG